tara:strand:- start:23341 stop:23583 length:243 start_codon:yes stop_codon:yes gene_type:complete
MKYIRVVDGTYQVKFQMRDMVNRKSSTVSVGVYNNIKDALEIRDFVVSLKPRSGVLFKHKVLKLINEKREEMGYSYIRNS